MDENILKYLIFRYKIYHKVEITYMYSLASAKDFSNQCRESSNIILTLKRGPKYLLPTEKIN